ncbi:hypothetical protein G6F57_020806 [Rhizopus arrhizus]|nr:hypothetical protein G6F35_015032 [Rhizopus arrhizus]KAG1436114.1 hypothetical protein G6F57_020806 [Rhizopus arrhizus]
MPRSIIHSTTPGSSRPGRVPMGRPSRAVNPIVLSTLLPSCMAQADTPEPKCAAMILPIASRESRSGARLPGTAIRAARSGRPRRSGCGGTPCRSRPPAESTGVARGSRGWAPGCWVGAAAQAA